MRLFTKSALWIGVGVLIGSTLPAVAQEIGSMDGTITCSPYAQFDWYSTCEKPKFDFDDARTAEGVDNVRFEFNEYQQCLKRQADNDAQHAARRIYAAANSELATAKSEAVLRGFSIQ